MSEDGFGGNTPAHVASPIRLSAGVLYVAFFLSGMGCAVPGVLLPSLLREWHLSDARAGLLAFLFWQGSSLGALLVRRSLQRTIVGGYAACAVGLAMLAIMGERWAMPGFGLFGLGLGIAMTAISLMRQRTAEERRSVELIRLNLTWALGAVVTPVLVLNVLQRSRSGSLLGSAAAVALAVGGAVLLLVPNAVLIEQRSGFSRRSWTALRAVPLSLLILTVLTTGIEAGSGTWLATYAQRRQSLLTLTIAAPTCFWAGLLASRVLGSFSGAAAWLRRGAPALALTALGAVVLLIVWPQEKTLLVGAFLLGFGLGPLYPMLLARVLRYREVSTIFFLAGVCSALLPWLIGVASTVQHSLRAGLMVLVGAAGVLAALSVREARRDVVSTLG